MKYAILDMLNSCDGFLSGEDISAQLGISRSAVWKHIKNLRSDGYDIKSVTGMGYRMETVRDIIIPQKLEQSVPGKVYYFGSVDSTNSAAKAAQNVPDKSLFIADFQSAGRGRLGRKWSCSQGDGIFMSIYITPDIPLSQIPQLTLIAGLAVCRCIKNSRIKWPNDIVLSGKKICGILTEMTAEVDRSERVIIGIGINVNNEVFTVDLIDKATSLYRETGRKHSRENLIRSVLAEFWELYDTFLKSGFSPLKAEYLRKCATVGREVLIIKNGEPEKAFAKGITDGGELITEQDGKTLTVNSGEVSVRGLLGYI